MDVGKWGVEKLHGVFGFEDVFGLATRKLRMKIPNGDFFPMDSKKQWENIWAFQKGFKWISWVVPPPSKSHHQDYYIFSRESQPKPSFPLLLGGGTTQWISLNSKRFQTFLP